MEEKTLKLSIKYDNETASGAYANLSIVSSSVDETRIDFFYVDGLNVNEKGEQAAYLTSRVILSHTQAVMLRDSLSRHIENNLELAGGADD